MPERINTNCRDVVILNHLCDKYELPLGALEIREGGIITPLRPLLYKDYCYHENPSKLLENIDKKEKMEDLWNNFIRCISHLTNPHSSWQLSYDNIAVAAPAFLDGFSIFSDLGCKIVLPKGVGFKPDRTSNSSIKLEPNQDQVKSDANFKFSYNLWTPPETLDSEFVRCRGKITKNRIEFELYLNRNDDCKTNILDDTRHWHRISYTY